MLTDSKKKNSFVDSSRWGDSNKCDSSKTTDMDDIDRKRIRQIGVATAVGGIAGLVIFGPVGGIVGAGGGAALAATNTSKAGDVARSTGNVAADAGNRIRHFEKKHKIIENTTDGIIDGCNWVSQKFRVRR